MGDRDEIALAIRDAVDPKHGSLPPENFHVEADAVLSSDWLAKVKAEARAEVGTRFAEWAAKNEIASPPLDWAWFGEIVRWTGSPAHEANLADAGLLAAPVDGELRHRLACVVDEHRLTTPVQCLCKWREADSDTDTWAEHLADQLLPAVAAHVQAEKAKAFDEGWSNSTEYRYAPNPYLIARGDS